MVQTSNNKDDLTRIVEKLELHCSLIPEIDARFEELLNDCLSNKISYTVFRASILSLFGSDLGDKLLDLITNEIDELHQLLRENCSRDDNRCACNILRTIALHRYKILGKVLRYYYGDEKIVVGVTNAIYNPTLGSMEITLVSYEQKPERIVLVSTALLDLMNAIYNLVVKNMGEEGEEEEVEEEGGGEEFEELSPIGHFFREEKNLLTHI
jgi:hypothetical protein